MIIGIDPGTHCGWAVRTADGSLLSGEWDLSGTRFDGAGMRYLRLARLLDELIDSVKPRLVAFEEVRRHIGTTAAHVYGAYVGVIQRECEDRKVPCTGIPVASIKKYATGKGNSDKDAMVAAANAKWPGKAYSLKNNNEVDARWIAEVAVRELG